MRRRERPGLVRDALRLKQNDVMPPFMAMLFEWLFPLLCSEQYCRTDGLSVKPTAHNPSPPSRQQQGSPSPLLLSLERLFEVWDSREGTRALTCSEQSQTLNKSHMALDKDAEQHTLKQSRHSKPLKLRHKDLEFPLQCITKQRNMTVGVEAVSGQIRYRLGSVKAHSKSSVVNHPADNGATITPHPLLALNSAHHPPL
ncbi:hypothetical protein AOLI_G00119190 [Acnodon oligacanthus]